MTGEQGLSFMCPTCVAAEFDPQSYTELRRAEWVGVWLVKKGRGSRKGNTSPNLILCLQVKKRGPVAQRLRTHSVSANLELSMKKTHLSSARSAALGETWEPRWFPTAQGKYYRAPLPPQGFPVLVGSPEPAAAPPHPSACPCTAPCIFPHLLSTASFWPGRLFYWTQ